MWREYADDLQYIHTGRLLPGSMDLSTLYRISYHIT